MSTQVSIGDRNFDEVFNDWTVDVFVSIAENEVGMNFSSEFEIMVRNHDNRVLPITQLKSDLKIILKRMQNSDVMTSILCYDKDYYPLTTLSEDVNKILKARRRKDYTLAVSNSKLISDKLDEHISDYPIPALNLVLINYTGTKKVIHLDDSLFAPPHDDSDEDE